MKDLVIGNLMSNIRSKTNYDEVKLAEIKYGLTSLYLLLTKLVVITSIAIILGIFKEYVLFIALYNLIRSPSFGIHASKSWICWVASTIMFVGLPYLCTIITIDVNVICLLGIIGIYCMYKNSPADTKKRPIVSKKFRLKLKFISVITAIIFVAMAIIIDNNFLSNCFIFTLILQCFIISPYVYKLFKLPYNNYIDFIKKHPDFPTE